MLNFEQLKKQIVFLYQNNQNLKTRALLQSFGKQLITKGSLSDKQLAVLVRLYSEYVKTADLSYEWTPPWQIKD